MRINPTSIKPFFQTVLYQNSDFNKEKFDQKLWERIKKYNYKKKKNIKTVDNGINNSCFYFVHSIKELPTWYKHDTEVTNSLKVENHENRIIALTLLYYTKNFIFLHSTNDTLSEMYENILHTDLRIRKINISALYSVLNDDNLQIRSLGINNTFGAGGSAPESKTYHGKDTQYSLNLSFDSGYSFNYCLATKQIDKEHKTTFGCSTKKRKVWGSWLESITNYVEKCKEIEEVLLEEYDEEIFDILVNPVNNYNPSDNNLFEFYLDYTVQNKGLVFIEFNSRIITDWYSHLKESNVISIKNDDNEILLDLKWTGTVYSFSYNNKETAKIIFGENEHSLLNKKRYDLVDYLNKDQNFTLIFDKGIAYREETFWKDNRLNNVFKTIIGDKINWTDVDIKRESKDARDPAKINISTKIENLIKDKYKSEIFILINDDGANEVADHLCVFSDRIILIHEKYSAKEYVGLRVDDIQVVVAQALKNIKYFIPLGYESIIERLESRIVHKNNSFDNSNLLNKIYESIRNPNAQNECWIVQPGISKKKLEEDKNNKIHSLLNYTEGICRNNNIKFKFYSNL